MSGHLEAIVRAVEALEDGDEVYAYDILRGALDESDRPVELNHRCSVCGISFEFPGQLDHHMYFVHGRAA